MTRQEFLDELRVALQGEMDQSHINEHLRYYENYIMEEARKGRTEQQVVDDLGNPRLIAKTLIEAEQYGGGSYGRASEAEWQNYGRFERGTSKDQTSKGFQADYSREKGWDIRYGKFRINSWYGILILIAIAIMIIVLVASLVAFLLPIVIPVVLILVVLSLVLGGGR